MPDHEQCSCGRPKHKITYNASKQGVQLQTVFLCAFCDGIQPRPQPAPSSLRTYGELAEGTE